MEKVVDRRCRKTIKAIEIALIELLTDREISRVKIKDICERADVNRSTFYLHFYDVYDVYSMIEKEAIDDIMALMSSFDFCSLTLNPYPMLKAVSFELEKVPALKLFLVKSPSAHAFLSSVKARFCETILELYGVCNQTEKEKLRFSITFSISGAVDVYEEWLKTGEKISIEQLCKEISEQISGGVSEKLARFMKERSI